jgi:hypothetical protein
MVGVKFINVFMIVDYRRLIEKIMYWVKNTQYSEYRYSDLRNICASCVPQKDLSDRVLDALWTQNAMTGKTTQDDIEKTILTYINVRQRFD